MRERPQPPGAGPPHRSLLDDQSGIEGIEVALITGLITVIILATIPLVAGGVQAVISALATELTTAGGAIN